VISPIGAGSRGSCPSENILAPLGDFCPPEACILSHIWDKKTFQIRRRSFFFKERLLLGQKNAQIRRRPLFFILFYFFGERLFSGQKTLQFQRRPLFRVPDFGALGLAPPVQK